MLVQMASRLVAGLLPIGRCRKVFKKRGALRFQRLQKIRVVLPCDRNQNRLLRIKQRVPRKKLQTVDRMQPVLGNTPLDGNRPDLALILI